MGKSLKKSLLMGISLKIYSALVNATLEVNFANIKIVENKNKK